MNPLKFLTTALCNETPKLKAVHRVVSKERRTAERDATAYNKFVQSRGTWLCTGDKVGQCRPRAEAECPTWGGTLTEIKKLVAQVQTAYPDVERIYIAGGYDGFETFRDMMEHDLYTPWVAEWNVTLWTKDKGYEDMENYYAKDVRTVVGGVPVPV